jgi:hypothetical protein
MAGNNAKQQLFSTYLNSNHPILQNCSYFGRLSPNCLILHGINCIFAGLTAQSGSFAGINCTFAFSHCKRRESGPVRSCMLLQKPVCTQKMAGMRLLFTELTDPPPHELILHVLIVQS